MKAYKYVVIILALFTSVCMQAKEPLISLFNGQNLDGWTNVYNSPDTWAIENEILICSGQPQGVLRTDKQYENYILELEWQRQDLKGENALLVHADALPATGGAFMRAFEINLDGEQGNGIRPLYNAFLIKNSAEKDKGKNSKPNKKWNTCRIESLDGMLTATINGNVQRVFNCNPRKGYICLTANGSSVHYKNINIRELPPSNTNEQTTALPAQGFVSLFNHVNLDNWKHVKGNEGHWQVKDGIISYDGKSEAEGEDRHLWTAKDYKDFVLIVDWRQPSEPKPDAVQVILPDGSYAVNKKGKQIKVTVPDAGDSGIYLRGTSKSQINIWNWPIGSGEIWGYRTDDKMPAQIRKAATPIVNADNPIGEWNRFEITVKGSFVTVLLNGKRVINNAELPDMPETGPIALQHHGDPVEFTNIFIKEL